MPVPGTEINDPGVEPAGASATILAGGDVQAFLDGDACVRHGRPPVPWSPPASVVCWPARFPLAGQAVPQDAEDRTPGALSRQHGAGWMLPVPAR